MPSEFKPAKRRLFRRGPSRPIVFARFQQELDAVRVPPVIYSDGAGRAEAFRIIAALYNTLVPQRERQAKLRDSRARDAAERSASRKQHSQD